MTRLVGQHVTLRWRRVCDVVTRRIRGGHVTPAASATRCDVLAWSVYQGATGERRMLVFAGLAARRASETPASGGGLAERETEADGEEQGHVKRTEIDGPVSTRRG